VVAIARPVERTTERTQSEGQIMVLFDVSLSMEATDVDPNRLDAAKEAARNFIDEVDDDVEVGLISFAGVVRVEVEPTLDRDRVIDRVDELELDEATAIGDAIAVGTDVLLSNVDDEELEQQDDVAPGALVLLTDGTTTVGRDTAAGAAVAADAGVPVFTIAFGTVNGVITDPLSGEIFPVPVEPEELEIVSELTGGQSFEAQTGNELADAYDEVRDSLGDTLGEEIEITKELTWRWALAAFTFLSVAWALSLWWLRGMV
jgi:Ca-activated chloride channel family protein